MSPRSPWRALLAPTALVCAAAGALWAAPPQSYDTLEAARRVAQRGESLRGRVSGAVGREALAELDVARVDHLLPLARVAEAGGAGREAGRMLLARALSDPDAYEACLVALLDLPRESADPSLKERRGELGDRVSRAREPSLAAIRAYTRVGAGKRIWELYRSWERRKLVKAQQALLEGLGDHGDFAEVFATALEWDLEAPFEDALCAALGKQIKASKEVRAAALSLLRKQEAALPGGARLARALAEGDARSPELEARLSSALGGKEAEAVNGLRGLLALRACSAETLAAAAKLAERGRGQAQIEALLLLPRLLSYRGEDARGAADQVDRALASALGSSQVGVVVAGIDGGRQRGLRELRQRLPSFLASSYPEVQLAAIRAAPKLLELNDETAGYLLELFQSSDAEVGLAAWKALEAWGKVRIPRQRSDRWAQWRRQSFSGG